MNPIFEFFFSQYAEYELIDVILEITAVIFGLLSVWFSKQNNILVFPTGMVSTSIYVYLLFHWDLIGDMMINLYYFIMSVYGWYIWTRKIENKNFTPITFTSKTEKKLSIYIFIVTLVFVVIVYNAFDKWNSWVAYVDTFTTGVFFVGMWLMAKRKIENWVLWIIGNIISVPLYFYKGFTFTSFQYLIFTILAIYGYSSWKNKINTSQEIA